MRTRVRARDAKNKRPDPNGHPFFTAARFSLKCWKTLYCITQRVFMDGDGRGWTGMVGDAFTASICTRFMHGTKSSGPCVPCVSQLPVH